MHCHFVVTFLSVTGRDTLDLHSTTILKLMFLWCVMPFQLNHLRSYNCLLNSKVIEIVVLTIHLWICLCTTQGFKADFCWNKKGGCVLLCIRGRYYQRRGKANNQHFFFFFGSRGDFSDAASIPVSSIMLMSAKMATWWVRSQRVFPLSKETFCPGSVSPLQHCNQSEIA